MSARMKAAACAAGAGRYRPYPAYKDSGVEWLGEIPEHWEPLALKRATSIRYGLGQPPQLLADGLPFIRATNVAKGRIVDRDMQFVDPKDVPWSRDPTLRTGDIIVVRSGAYTGDSAIVPQTYDGAIAGYDMVVRVRRGWPRFLAWALLSRYVLEAQIELESMRAAQPHLNAEELGTVAILLPPEPEQRAIAAFLDRETARIDALVAKNERLIALLQEQRTALITRAVTKGLDPTVPMKDSGVEWLGEIPAHWELKRLRHALSARPRNGISPPIGPVGDVPTFSTAAVNDGEVLIDKNVKYTMLAQREAQPYIVAIGDIFLLRGSGSRNIVGRAGILKREPPLGCIYPDILIRVLPSRLVNPWFLVNSLNSTAVRFQIESLAQTASGIWKISGEDVRTLALAVPPYDEQLQIQGEVSRHTARLDALTAKVRDAIERLKELRTALISAAVTGKIDVREEVA